MTNFYFAESQGFVRYSSKYMEEAQWLIGRVLDLRSSGCGFKPHRIVSLSKTH